VVETRKGEYDSETRSVDPEKTIKAIYANQRGEKRSCSRDERKGPSELSRTIGGKEKEDE